VILVASWCAPCRAELARLDGIAAASGGRTLRVLAIDDSAATVRMLRAVDPARQWRPAIQEVARVRAALLARTAGLPYSVATDARGLICAEENGGLDAARTTAMMRRCDQP
jgi:thiol-disulfide isomerase/thioredoxin